MKYFVLKQETQSAAPGESSVGAYVRAGTGVFGQQTDEKNRETGDGDLLETDHTGDVEEGKSGAREHAGAGAGGSG